MPVVLCVVAGVISFTVLFVALIATTSEEYFAWLCSWALKFIEKLKAK